MTNTYDQNEDENPVDNQGNNSSKPIIEVIKILLEEYKTLRQESLGSIRLRIQIVSFGLAAIILLFGVPLSLRSGFNIILINIIYTFVIPLLCTIIVNIWLGELYRMERAGNFMYLQEIRINKAINKYILLNNKMSDISILSWEGWLRKKVGIKQMWPIADADADADADNKDNEIETIMKTVFIKREELKITTAYEKSVDLFYWIAYGSCIMSLLFPIILHFSTTDISTTNKTNNYFNNIGSGPIDTSGPIVPISMILFIITLIVLFLLTKSRHEANEQYKIIRNKTNLANKNKENQVN
jgi:hypothetical protein